MECGILPYTISERAGWRKNLTHYYYCHYYYYHLTIFLLSISVLNSSLGQERKRYRSDENRYRPSDDDDTDSAETSDQCPEPNGYFADDEQCDKYYACKENAITEKLCPDGMVFNDYDPNVEKCDLPFNIDCSTRSKLQEPQPTLHCRRANGYFEHENPNVCDKFYFCVDGKFNAITCPAGLVYNEKTGICTWPDEAKKSGCLAKDVFAFSCPAVAEAEAGKHPRYADPSDCQFFYVCINGQTPRRSGCKLGQAFDERTNRCEWARTVPRCKDWYKDRLTDAELEALENPDAAAPAVAPKQKGPGSTRNKNKDNLEVTEEQQQSTRKNLFNNSNRRRQQTRGQRRTTTTTTTTAAPAEEIIEYEYEEVEE
ncbi:protein obstructor-E [Ctenocephalides felis]|uniref:protein obstructor-E n=1 Tax=Ctenocephalides felis TaxID=7515 RepID=UPI000E6E1B35|nr:protein obstructor-E [Ctenocephalides felis]